MIDKYLDGQPSNPSTESRRLAALDFVFRLIISAPDDVEAEEMDDLMQDMYGLYNAIEDKEQVDFIRLKIEEDVSAWNRDRKVPLLHDKLPFYTINKEE